MNYNPTSIKIRFAATSLPLFRRLQYKNMVSFPVQNVEDCPKTETIVKDAGDDPRGTHAALLLCQSHCHAR